MLTHDNFRICCREKIPAYLQTEVFMEIFQPKDSRGYFMLPQAPEGAGYVLSAIWRRMATW